MTHGRLCNSGDIGGCDDYSGSGGAGRDSTRGDSDDHRANARCGKHGRHHRLYALVPRQGDAVTTVVDLISMPSSDARLKVELQMKNSEEVDSAATSNGSVTIQTTTAAESRLFRGTSGIEELVRYKITLHRDSGSGTIYSHFRILSPSWETTGAQGV